VIDVAIDCESDIVTDAADGCRLKWTLH